VMMYLESWSSILTGPLKGEVVIGVTPMVGVW
jgi:hypothetical protein